MDIKNRAIRVAFITVAFGNNPYLLLLSKHLQSLNIQVAMMRGHPIWFFSHVRDKKIDVVHFHDFIWFQREANFFRRLRLYFLLIGQLLLLKLTGIKIVITLHNPINKRQGRPLFSWLGNVMIFGLANAVIVHYPLEMNDFSLPINKRKIHLIPHPHYCDYYKNTIGRKEARSYLNLDNEVFVFTFFGCLSPPKGVLELIESFKKLSKKDVKLIIVGNPTDERYKCRVSQLALENENIILVPGPVPKDVQIYFNASDCIVFPYRIPTTSGVAVLAMSFGKACIAPRKGHFKYILNEEGAFLYDFDQGELGLLGAMNEALQNRHRLSRMGEHNLEIVKRYDWLTAAEKTSRIYQNFRKKAFTDNFRNILGRKVMPKEVAYNAVLKNEKEYKNSVKEAGVLGLPIHKDLPKNWDSLAALSIILKHVDKNSSILDAGGEFYSVVLPQLEAFGYRSLMAINLGFRKTTIRGSIKYEKGDITRTRFDDGTFDAITCLSVIEHGVEPESFFKEMHRILKIDGILFVSADYWSEPVNIGRKIAFGRSMRIFSRQDILDIVKIAEKYNLHLKAGLELNGEDKVIKWRGLNYTFIYFTLQKVK